MDILLKTPDAAMAGEIMAFRAEMLAAGSSMDGTGALQDFETAEAWLEDAKLCARWETLPYPDWVPATQLAAWRESDERLVGMFQIRHCLNDHLRLFGGHIGYSVRPSERRKGYAAEMLRQGLDWCRELGLPQVLITCEEHNEGSRRTILKNGGVYESTVWDPSGGIHLERYWLTL